MKKIKLIKGLVIGAPIILTPLLANSCSSNNNGKKEYFASTIQDNAQMKLTPLSGAMTNSPVNITEFSFETLKGMQAVNYLDTDYAADKSFITDTLQLEPDKTFNTLNEFEAYAQPALNKANEYSFSDLTEPSKTGRLGAVKSKYQWFGTLLKSNGIDLATKTIFSESDLSSVTEINYQGQNFSGQEFPDNVGALQSLTSVSLRSDRLTGTLPPSLYLDQGITELLLFSNNFYGTIPASYGYLTNLTRANFCINKFTGSIPESFADNTTYPANHKLDLTKGSLKNIQTFLFEINNISGSIPTNMGTLQTLTTLGLFTMELTGSIPSSFDNLTNLSPDTAAFNVTGNHLTGSESTRFPASGWPGWGRQTPPSGDYLNLLQNINVEKIVKL